MGIARHQVLDIDTDKLQHYENNAKLHPKEQVDQLIESIASFGFLDPIAYDENFIIIEGHGRHLAAKQMGLKLVPAFLIAGMTEPEKIAYRIFHNKSTMNSDLDLELLKGDIELLVDADFDLDLTGFGAEDISLWVEDFEEWAEKEEVQRDAIEQIKSTRNNGFVTELDREEPKVEDEIEVEKLLEDVGKVESRVKLGEIWQLGRHKIACGDSTLESNVRALLGDRLAVLCHADPPYGMGKEKDGVMNDNLYREKLDVFQMKWIKACRKKVENNSSFYIWGNAEDLWRLWYCGGLKDSERLTFRNQVVWDKKHGQGMLAGEFRMFPTVTEHCLFFMLGEQGFNNNADNYWEGWEPIRAYLKNELKKVGDIKWAKRAAGHSETSGCHWFDSSQWTMPTEEVYMSWQSEAKGKAFDREYDAFKREYDDLKREWYSTRAYFDNTHDNMTDVWEYPRVQGEERWGHATPKPVDMISRIYKSSSPNDGLIYSPFLGSGTDIIAAQKMEGDRTVYGFELSPDYCEVIIKRFEQFTCDTAKLIGSL